MRMRQSSRLKRKRDSLNAARQATTQNTMAAGTVSPSGSETPSSDVATRPMQEQHRGPPARCGRPSG